eukprot:XP_001707915.1 Hypothetical protein GL50803_35150 [Giardia lamblia ATCC 50803]
MKRVFFDDNLNLSTEYILAEELGCSLCPNVRITLTQPDCHGNRKIGKLLKLIMTVAPRKVGNHVECTQKHLLPVLFKKPVV